MRDSFFRQAMAIAVPVSLQAMLQSSFSMIDQVMVGQLGGTQVAAVEIGGKPGFVFTFVSGAVAAVAGIMISQYMGKRDEKSVRGSVSVNLCAALLLGLITTGLCLALPGRIAALYTADAAVIGEALAYIRLIVPVFPMSGVAGVLAVEIRCRGHARIPLYISAAAAVINTLLNALLIFGRWGLPALGVRGAALATVISQALQLTLMMAAHRRRCGFHFQPRIGWPAFRRYLGMLLPAAANELLWTVSQNIYTGIYGHMGTAELAAMALTGPVQGMLTGALSGLSQAAGILIGQRLGEGDYEQAYRQSKRLCVYGLLGSLGLALALAALRGAYAGLYRVEQNVQALGAQLLMLFALLLPVKVQNMILGGGVIRSGGRTHYIMIIDTLGAWLVGVPLGLITGRALGWPIGWVYLALSMEEVFRLILSVILFRSRKWMQTIA
ncbi:MAG: MATE family efflux transporter [Clostridia bacterium]|nr:MATE family efflux transporter [Clostridia bacterium]